MNVLLVFTIVLISTAAVQGLDNGQGKTPQMGWNSWNHFGCNINEELIRNTATAIAKGPLFAAGYKYVNLDDCWQTARNKTGYIIEDPKAFPSGMPSLIKFVHSLGLKFGLYSDAGFTTCAGRPGSLSYEKQDAAIYAEWNVDYLKYDNCNDNHTDPKIRYPVMRDALLATHNPLFFSMCEWGIEDPATWAPEVGNSWRTTGDINDSWGSMIANINENNKWAQMAGPGAWNDPDMLEVGNGGMTDAEYYTHFGLWAISKSPLLVGCDVTNMTKTTIDILTNPEAIAINQDALGVQGRMVSSQNGAEVWAGPLMGRKTAILLLNTGTSAQKVTADFATSYVPVMKAAVRDVWAQKDLGEFTSSYSATLNSHASALLTLTW